MSQVLCLVGGQQVGGGGRRRHQDRRRLLERRAEHGAEIRPLLPRHLAGTEAESEVVDEDRGWRGASPASRRAWPAGVPGGGPTEPPVPHPPPPRLPTRPAPLGGGHHPPLLHAPAPPRPPAPPVP